MICPKCGVLLPDNITKCGNCGFMFTSGGYDQTQIEIISEKTKIIEEIPTQVTTIFQEIEEKPIYGWLVIIDGPNKWKEYRIPDEEKQYLIGKDESCTIRLEGKGIEKFHASLRIRENKLYITDLDTESGTFVNDNLAVKTEVKDGDTIKIGNVVLKFRKF